MNSLMENAQFYRENGYLSVPNLLTQEDVTRLQEAFAAAEEAGSVKVGLTSIENQNDAIFRHPVFQEFASDPRIVSLAEALIGRPIELQHSKFFNKPKDDLGKGNVKWHQDFPFFPHTNYDLFALAIHLDDETPESGPIRVIPKSHTWGLLTHQRDGEFAYECTEPVDFEDKEIVELTGPAGHITVHHGLTLHASRPKTSTNHRRILYLQYRAMDAIQLAGVVWRCTGFQVGSTPPAVRTARFPDGSSIEIRGRLYDVAGTLAPDRSEGRSITG